MKVHLVRTRNFSNNQLRKVHELLYPHFGAMNFVIEEKILSFETNNFIWKDFFSEAVQYRNNLQLPSEEIIVVITNLKNEPEWFSAPNPEGTNEIFIDGSDWENYIYAEPAYPIAYEVIANVLQRFLFRSWNDVDSDLVHKEARGCINDFCDWKPDITFKLRTADICSECLSALEERLPDKTIIDQSINILESLRKGMLYSKMWHKAPEFEEYLPFPLAQSKRKLGMTQQPYQKLQLLIEHFDSIVRTAVVVFGHLLLTEDTLKEVFTQKGLNTHPSLGHWVAALKNIIQRGAVLHAGFELPGDIIRKLDSVYRLIETNRLVSLRNEQAHSYTQIRAPYYITEFKEKSKVASEIEAILNPLFKRLKYYQVVSTEIMDGNKFNLQVLNFSGSNSSFLETKIETAFEEINQVPRTNRLYIVSPNCKHWISLEPHWIFHLCPTCNHPRLLISDGVQYIDPLIGHRVTCSNLV